MDIDKNADVSKNGKMNSYSFILDQVFFVAGKTIVIWIGWHRIHFDVLLGSPVRLCLVRLFSYSFLAVPWVAVK